MMDRKEAADLLDNLIGMVEDNHGADYDTALKMGIEAIQKYSTWSQTYSNMVEDVISRQAAIDALGKRWGRTLRYNGTGDYIFDECKSVISALPSAQPPIDEWCTDCKEYDQERNCCPRWNRVIRQTLKEAQPEIIRCRECVKRKICRTTTIWAVAPDDDWFCADAERREE